MDKARRMALLAELIYMLQPGRKLMCGSEAFRTPLQHLYVHFYTESGVEIADINLPRAMDCLMNDVWHFEDYDLRAARSVEIQIH